jgi:hypothetical protein
MTLIIFSLIFFALSPFFARALSRLILERAIKRNSELMRRLRTELLGLDQIREHWRRLEGELSPLDDVGRRAWIDQLRADSGL